MNGAVMFKELCILHARLASDDNIVPYCMNCGTVTSRPLDNEFVKYCVSCFHEVQRVKTTDLFESTLSFYLWNQTKASTDHDGIDTLQEFQIQIAGSRINQAKRDSCPCCLTCSPIPNYLRPAFWDTVDCCKYQCYTCVPAYLNYSGALHCSITTSEN